jgi:hypothetical protein
MFIIIIIYAAAVVEIITERERRKCLKVFLGVTG